MVAELEERAINEFYIYALEESRNLPRDEFERFAKILDKTKMIVLKRLGEVVDNG